LFLSSFDVSSDPARKNPEAAIAAFLEAFPEGDGRAHLVIKAHNARLLPEAQERMAQLERLVAQHDHLHLFTERIAHEALPSFHASFDALISLHRSEGLGLILMEMMVQGKPVVATNWSGNLDFCTAENSVLVGFDLVPVEAVHPVYLHAIAEHPDLQWAEPRIDEAAAALRQLVEDPAWAARLGAQAREDMLGRVSIDCSPVIAALESLVANSPGNSPAQSHFFQQILSRTTPQPTWAERWVQLKRRLGIRGALIRKR
jgi:glycosyltransferase involved in cell wall biosynthesis